MEDDNRPVLGCGLFFCECGSQDNTHMLLGSWRDGDFVMWCSCGKVTIRENSIMGPEKKVVHDFHR
jgi:hypothetical protein